MSSRPLLSILVPTYNYADYLDEALQSLTQRCLELAPGEVEIVIVDDGSTDATPEVLERWRSHSHVVGVRQENRGVAAARNQAMSHARGELWMFFDSDDGLNAGCLRQTVDFFSSEPDIGMVFTNYDIYDSQGVVEPSGVDIWSMFRSIPHRELDEDRWVFETSLTPLVLQHGSFMHTSGLTVRRGVAEAAGRFREGFSYGEDDDYWARCAAHCSAGYIDRVLSRKRNHERSIIHDPRRAIANQRSLLQLTELQLREWPEHRAVLGPKSLRCAESLAWSLIENGEADRAAPLLRRYISLYPRHLALYRLAVKATLHRLI